VHSTGINVSVVNNSTARWLLVFLMFTSNSDYVATAEMPINWLFTDWKVVRLY
jgi:hypothetical protein